MQKNLTGQKFGKLFVVQEAKEKNKNREKLWLCECKCGKLKKYSTSDLLHRNRSSCGCGKANNKKELKDKKFGKLTVICDSKKRSKNREVVWLCKCDCGNEKEVISKNLLNSTTTHCGCSYVRSSIHNHCTDAREKGTSITYISWGNMIQRCCNPKHTHYKYYGGAGIKVDKRWKKFENFLKDMGERPSKNHTIERIDNNKGYNANNCKWATRKEQAQNRKPKTGKGYYWNKTNKKWIAYLKGEYLGSFGEETEAKQARQRATRKRRKRRRRTRPGS